LKESSKALVTGGTRGIGKAIAEKLLAEGMEVYVSGTSETSQPPKGCSLLVVDFLSESSVLAFLEEVRRHEFVVVVNNAGINKVAEFEKIELEDFQNIQRVNLEATFRVCQAALGYMRSVSFGRIVNITSIFGHISKEYRASYSASKFGVDGMTTALAVEIAEYGILANSVGPGFIDTDLTRRVLGEEGMKLAQAKIPMKRMGQPEEIAQLVSYLVSQNNTYLTGQNIIIDGGFSRV
jgi:NAD(P)-dependent dehydrogenase (short-subunit alcohol dehydrogenase family)